MVNPAATAKLNNPAFSVVKSKHRHGITLQDPITKKCCFESQVGQIYHYGANLEEVDTSWEQDTDANYLKMVKADFNLRARKSFSAGDLLKWTDPVTGQYVLLQPNNLSWVDHVTESQQFISSPAAVTGQATDDRIYWPAAYGSGRHWEYIAGTSRLSKHLIIDAAANLPTPTVSNPYLEIAFVMTPSAGVNLIIDGGTWDKKTKKNTVNAIEFRTSAGTTLWSFSAPMAFDSAGNRIDGIMQLRKQSKNLIVSVRIPQSFFQTATYPVYVDPTLDYQVGASADDGRTGNNLAESNGNTLYLGHYGSYDLSMWARFLAVTIPVGSTINSAYISLNAQTDNNSSVTARIYANDVDSPTNPSSHADYDGKALTTAYVNWTINTLWSSGGWYDTPSLVSVVQERVDSGDYSSGLNMLFLIKGTNSGDLNREINSYDYNASYAPKLHIEYSAASGSLVIPRRNRTFDALLVR